jgi:MinD-like ATPase involved in chromosome partitioning or flagellar assembly
MYTVTFYSFKGGVGRTMAMANVGLKLARAGSRVLLVDFDLEAPGLDTFDVLKPAEASPGLVEFVTEYQETGIAPDVTQFIYEPPNLVLDGKVWVMPTGRQDANYGALLNAIDWQQLYAEQRGYVLFEDLKAQWEQALRPDYVLIDSRTGHTDVGGICTRQLPDAVVLLFFPNEQNRRGLKAVVQEIQQESRDSKRDIQLHFVAANVPDLDDENEILSERLKAFRQTLGYEELDAQIHHYDSLSLLQQTVFTIERPQTQLAREYATLAKSVTYCNLEDRTVVMEYLDGGWMDSELSTSPGDLEDHFGRIKARYAHDGAVLHA